MKEWVQLILLGIVTTCCLFSGGVQPVSAAQSTADVVVDSAQKDQLRREIVGDEILPGEQQEYVVGLGDVLSVSIYGEGDMAASAGVGVDRSLSGGGKVKPNKSGGVKVRMDGRVSLLHIGDIQIAGMTLTQSADYLKKLYLTVFDDPIITVVLVQSNSRRYTVMGEVNGAGIFSLDFPLTIVQAIARSGGFAKWANHDVTVIRQGSPFFSDQHDQAAAKGKKQLQFDYDDFLNGKHLEENVYIQPNDVVIVH